MSRFAKILRYLCELYPPSENQPHNPLVVLDTIQLVQEAVPETELQNETHFPTFVSVTGVALAGIAEGEFVSLDPVPSGVRGVAFVIWAAEVELTAGVGQSVHFALEDAAGTTRVRLFTGSVSASSITAAAPFAAASTYPFIVPQKTRLVVRSAELSGTLVLRYIRSIIQRGERLPYF